MEIEFPAENVPCGSIDLWIAERTEIVGRIEEADLNPEAAERLAEFEGYDPGADDCETFRQVFEIEDCVAGDNPPGEVVKRVRYQNIDIIEPHKTRFVVLLAGDHIYKMDYELMLRQHVEQRADVTIGCLEMPRSESSGFGIMHVDDHGVIQSFLCLLY